jgi:hypothetical protein
MTANVDAEIAEIRAREPKCLTCSCPTRLHAEHGGPWCAGCGTACGAPPEPPPIDPRTRVLGALQRYGARLDERRTLR